MSLASPGLGIMNPLTAEFFNGGSRQPLHMLSPITWTWQSIAAFFTINVVCARTGNPKMVEKARTLPSNELKTFCERILGVPGTYISIEKDGSPTPPNPLETSIIKRVIDYYRGRPAATEDTQKPYELNSHRYSRRIGDISVDKEDPTKALYIIIYYNRASYLLHQTLTLFKRLKTIDFLSKTMPILMNSTLKLFLFKAIITKAINLIRANHLLTSILKK